MWRILTLALLLASCGAPEAPAKLTVAAASDLIGTMDEIAREFREMTGVEVVLSYGSTAQLTQQIEHGAPIDLFAAADTLHVDQLIAIGKLLADSRAVYARGQIALWAPNGERLGIRTLNDLARREVRFVSIAQPSHAPYGQAAVEAIVTAGLREQIQPKLVYAGNASLARQFAATGNADATVTAYSLVRQEAGTVLKIPLELYQPLHQALGVVSASPNIDLARRFAAFLNEKEAKAIFLARGYLLP